MDKEQRAALRKVAEEATPGPWIGCGPSFGDALPKYLNEVTIDREGDEDDGYQICRPPVGLDDKCSADFAYIAAANPQAILQLLDHIEALERDAGRERKKYSGAIYSEAQYLAAQQRTAEACAKVVDSLRELYRNQASGAYDGTYDFKQIAAEEIIETIRNGEWREYL